MPTIKNSEPIFQGLEVIEHECAIDVDRDLSVEALLRAGQYHSVDRKKVNNRHFPILKGGKLQENLVILEFRNAIHPNLYGLFNREGAIAETIKRNLRSADIACLLSLGASNHNLELYKGPIIALGSQCTLDPQDDPLGLDPDFHDRKTVAPMLMTGKGFTRNVDAIDINKIFLGGTRILAVK